MHSVTRSLSRGGARGEAGAGLQGPAWSWSCRQSLPDSLAAWGPVRPRALPEGPVRACPCRPPWSARRLLEKRAVCCCVRVAPQRLRCQRLRRPGPTCFLGAPCSGVRETVCKERSAWRRRPGRALEDKCHRGRAWRLHHGFRADVTPRSVPRKQADGGSKPGRAFLRLRPLGPELEGLRHGSACSSSWE